jgi:hypothetical protein
MSVKDLFSGVRQLAKDGRMFGSFAFDLPVFLRNPIAPDQCSHVLKECLTRREDSFLNLLRNGIYANSSSPYLQLLKAAGLEYEEIAEIVGREGIEAALGQLFDAGVYLTIEEFKGRRPIRRLGLELKAEAADFDNPLITSHFEGSTGGSRGTGTRLVVDLDLIALDTLTHALFLKSFELESSPMALWRPLPPGVAGIKKALMEAKLRKGIERWFCQNENRFFSRNFKYRLFLIYATRMSRICGARFPQPEFVPVSESVQVANWLAAKVRQGVRAHLDTNATSAVRVLQAGEDNGLDISGSFFRLGGEPLTAVKVKMVEEAGCRAVCHYSMGEVGNIGMACADPVELDDVHISSHKMAVLLRPGLSNGCLNDAFYLTTLAPVCPKIMLNVASGDYGVLEERECGCAMGELGFRQHIHSIRSYEKLTSDGMQFLGSDLLLLLEQVLPQQFGGGPHDYQFVETEVEGVTKVQLIASDRLGPLEEERVLQTTLEFLGSRAPENRMMVQRWKEGETLSVKRAEPYVTKAAKLLPLHLLRKDES